MSGSPFSWGTRVLAVGAILFALALGVGALLPGTWEARRTGLVRAEPDVVMSWMDGPQAWRRWTPWPDRALQLSGPRRGAGAAMSWNHPDMGDGRFEIVEVQGDSLVRYRVLVQDETMRTDGTLRLEGSSDGTRVTWTERGDFGWNPLMGFWALAMPTVQGEELQKGLERLDARIQADSAAAPDSAAPTDETGDLSSAGAPR